MIESYMEQIGEAPNGDPIYEFHFEDRLMSTLRYESRKWAHKKRGGLKKFKRYIPPGIKMRDRRGQVAMFIGKLLLDLIKADKVALLQQMTEENQKMGLYDEEKEDE